MSLQMKFAWLVLLVALTVVVSVGTGAWAVRLYDREHAASLTGAAGALAAIAAAAEPVAAQRELFGSATADMASSPAFPAMARLSAEVLAAADRIERDPDCRRRLGVTSCDSLALRLRQSQRGIASADPAAGEDLASVGALLDAMSRRVVLAAQDSAAHATELRVRLNLIFVLALAASAVLCVLTIRLTHRWVIAPVADLRRAAARLAQGDFQHRLPEKGDDELALLARDINHMSGMIVRMQEERIGRERLAAIGQMVRRLAHNLRNPLAGIRSLAELTRDDLPARSPLAENQERIVAAVDKFEQWLAELLDATSPMQLELDRRPVVPCLESVMEALRPMAKVRAVELKADYSAAPAEAVFDDRHLRHAVVALLSNAVEAAPSGGNVRLVAAADDRAETGRWLIRVEDDGPGVPPELTQRIFKADFTTKKEGNGIGLAVAQQVVRLHGGSIEVAAADHPLRRRGEALPGAVFMVSLPVDPRAAGTPMAA